MSSPDPRPLLVVIAGPTAVGKTEYAIQLAEKTGGEIISADSRLFYRGMDIGTAKPSPEDIGRVSHHMIDIADPDETWSLGRFQREAIKIIADIHDRGKMPLLVGGTGQYIRAITEGWEAPQQAPDPKMREVLSVWVDEIGGRGLYDRLAVIDPEAAKNMDPNNLRRTVRALEVIFLTGRLFSEQRRKGASLYRVLLIALTRPRPELYERIDLRVEKMMAAGFVEEVRGLLGKGYSPDLPSMSAIGYQQVVQHLAGEISLNEAEELIKRLSRRYVGRQLNWFKEDDPGVVRVAVGENTLGELLQLVEGFFDGGR